MTATQTMNGLTIETIDLRLSVSKIQFRQAEGPGQSQGENCKMIDSRLSQAELWQEQEFCQTLISITGWILDCFVQLEFGSPIIPNWLFLALFRFFLIWYSCHRDKMSKSILLRLRVEWWHNNWAVFPKRAYSVRLTRAGIWHLTSAMSLIFVTEVKCSKVF